MEKRKVYSKCFSILAVVFQYENYLVITRSVPEGYVRFTQTMLNKDNTATAAGAKSADWTFFSLVSCSLNLNLERGEVMSNRFVAESIFVAVFFTRSRHPAV